MRRKDDSGSSPATLGIVAPSACGHVMLLAIAFLGLVTMVASGDVLTDDFSSGVQPQVWSIYSNQPLYTWADGSGDVLLTKPAGGAGGLELIGLHLQRLVLGDFDLSAAFTDAAISHLTGTVGNQIQLNVMFGAQRLSVVRSDEAGVGNNAHVYADPPDAWIGSFVFTSAAAGTLRLQRQGSTVTASIDSTVLFQGSLGTGPLSSMSLTLQNNQTQDAIAVRFDDFSLVADSILAAAVFADGFEAGNLSAWSSGQP